MKSIILAATLAISTGAFAGGTLVKMKNHSGFGPKVYSSEISINENGKIVQVMNRGNEVETTELKTVSPNTIQSIKDDIESINAKDKLIDRDAGKPRCMDAPSSSISIIKNRKEVDVREKSLCHTFEMKSKAAQHLLSTVEKLKM
jgi:hypothetical protein